METVVMLKRDEVGDSRALGSHHGREREDLFVRHELKTNNG